MPVTLRRHLRTVKVDGKRVVPFSGKREGIIAGRKLITRGTRRIKSYSSDAERAVLGAITAQRAFGVRKNRVGLRRELSYSNFFIDEKKAMSVLETKFGNNEIKARNAWLKGDTFGGSVHPVKQISENIIKRRLGLALAAEAGKAGAGRKSIPIRNVVLDNVTHSWIVESVVKRLTRGMRGAAPKMKGLPKETTGLKIHFEKQPSGRFRVKMSYEEFSGDVTKNFKECMLPSLKKYLVD